MTNYLIDKINVSEDFDNIYHDNISFFSSGARASTLIYRQVHF